MPGSVLAIAEEIIFSVKMGNAIQRAIQYNLTLEIKPDFT